MEKVCIFCGERPESKNLEHVLPRWLIELTGNPKRRARFGYRRSVEGRPVERSFAFDAFKFPSCTECNQRFGELEAGGPHGSGSVEFHPVAGAPRDRFQISAGTEVAVEELVLSVEDIKIE